MLLGEGPAGGGHPHAGCPEPLEGETDLSGHERFGYVVTSAGLVLFAGLMSGLTLGLMGIDLLDLEILIRSGTASQKRDAQRVMPILRNQHLVLVTLLVWNAVAMEALPIFLDKLLGEVGAVLVSVSMVLLFGEIIPQALCKSYGLSIGSKCVWLVRVLQWAAFPISYPVSKLLDKLLGAHNTALFRRHQLEALVDLHAESGRWGGELSLDETNVIKGALKLSSKPAALGMTPLDKVFMLPRDQVLDMKTLDMVLASGFSRVPIYAPGDPLNVLGIIIVKELIKVNPEQGLRISHPTINIYALPQLSASTKMFDVLNIMQTGRSHLVLLTYDDRADVPLGQPSQPMSPARGDRAGPGPGPGRELRSRRQVAEEADEESVSLLVDEEEEPGSRIKESLLQGFARWSPLSPPSGNSPEGVRSKEEEEEEEPSTSDAKKMARALRDAQYAAFERLKVGGEPVVNMPIGVITLEDVIEELLQEEILDETDNFMDNEQIQRADTASLVQGLHPRLKVLADAMTVSIPPSHNEEQKQKIDFIDRKSAKRGASFGKNGMPFNLFDDGGAGGRQ